MDEGIENLNQDLPPEEDVEVVEECDQALADFLEYADMSLLASIQSVVSGVIKIIENPKSNAKDLKEVIEIDPPLTAKVLRHANSASLGTRRKISEIDQAVIWIGFEALKELALSQKVCEVFNDESVHMGFSRSELWKHSIAVALLGKMIYRKEFGLRGENMYAAGLMHDIGLIVLDQFSHEKFNDLLTEAKSSKRKLLDVEEELIGFNHIDLSTEVLKEWQLSTEMVEAVRGQKDVMHVREPYRRMAMTLFIANYLVQKKRIGYCDGTGVDDYIFKKVIKETDLNIFSLEMLVQDMVVELTTMERKGLF